MGYPHKPHAARDDGALQVLRRCAKRITLDGWKKRGGYKALEKALGMTPADIVNVVKDSGLRGRGGAGFPDGHEVVVHEARRRQAALPLLQRRRVRAGHVQGSRDHALDAARPGRGLRDRRVRDRRRDGVHLHPRRVHRAARPRWKRRVKEAYAAGILGKNAMGTGKTDRRAACTRAPARTSAAKRPR